MTDRQNKPARFQPHTSPGRQRMILAVAAGAAGARLLRGGRGAEDHGTGIAPLIKVT